MFQLDYHFIYLHFISRTWRTILSGKYKMVRSAAFVIQIQIMHLCCKYDIVI